MSDLIFNEDVNYNFFIRADNLALVFAHLSEISKQKHLTSAPDFYDYKDSPEFIFMVFVIANSLTD